MQYCTTAIILSVFMVNDVALNVITPLGRGKGTTTFSIMTISITTLSRTTLRITTLSITTLSITTLSRKKFNITINETQHSA
jgi:hypothetical protein